MSVLDNKNFEPMNIDQNAVTCRQQKLIDKICNVLGLDFSGTTKQEASKFISNHLPQYLEEKENI